MPPDGIRIPQSYPILFDNTEPKTHVWKFLKQ